ncbi:thiamine biosynthesis protein ThiF [[Phormidium ambiguum] IAM M-71]|uniref:Thiamine biosynthesis protein ThiF n=1 Tax=[Phormidium ambiguum] IAM M-71 TaxID=454136 RepID=A0A1U7I9K8_9CYAN|nr:ThiF family adenylyltransferase [Phormidium ambiguum]OKH33134.1 thiamine biosynthesis protein ThiF [Phormidium ambiguum IAM M-71]
MIDLTYSNSVPILTRHRHQINIWIVGTGGTGGWLVPSLARLSKVMETSSNKKVTCTLVDPDIIEAKNISRQNFIESEIGSNKALVLATRYNLALGGNLTAIPKPFHQDLIDNWWTGLTIIIGCVDNAAARYQISQCLDLNQNKEPDIWYLDCGNHANSNSGQVLLGSANQFQLKNAFDNPEKPSFCINLPSPTLQHPELLEPLPEELSNTSLSCAEIALRNQQALFVNQQVAAIATEYVKSLLLTAGLRRFATYFNSDIGSMRSRYICSQNITQYTT